jgi:acetylornithine deacetylase/succinyl-diaminopimelate desuccinylase-like protein
VEELCELARTPGISAAGHPPEPLVRSAEQVAALLSRCGLEHAEVLPFEDAHPYVIADWLHAGPSAPTALIYAHHDVQPPGREAHWKSPPFEPTRRSDGRLYGRGVVDDKAGIVLHGAAIRAWLDAAGRLPINVKVIVEGEEEIGSDHLAGFLRAHRRRLDCDVLVLSDTANLDTGIPSLTTSLRGIVAIDVTVTCLDHPLHSGMWGGPVPDAATALAMLLARLVDERGAIAVPGLEDDVPALSEEERARLAALPFDAERFRRDAGMPPGTPFSGDSAHSVYERLWLRPCLAPTALEGMELARAGNQLLASARARVGVRVAPGQDAERAARCVMDFLRRDPPLGARVELECRWAVPGWKTRPAGPAFDAALRALRAGYGRDPAIIGCGGSIPFVGPFAEVLGGVPALLLGLEDPACNAHSENESLDLGDFRRSQQASAHLLAELASGLSARSEPQASGDRRASGLSARSEPQASGDQRASGLSARSEP